MTVHDRLTASAFLRACRGERPDHVPVWFMRQAGRSLPEYRKVREGLPMLESCRRPDVVTEITIARPRGEVAAYASDPDNATAWYANIESVQWRTPPPLAVGTRLGFVINGGV